MILDPGLNPHELAAIRRALLSENNPSHLIGFASCLSPYFPVAASLLYARSQLLELREQSTQKDLAADGHAALESLRDLVDRESQAHGASWSGAQCCDWILCPLDTSQNLGEVTMRATRNAWSDVANAWLDVSPPPVPWPRLDRMRAAAEGLAALKNPDSRMHQIGRALCQPARADRSLAATLQAAGFHEHFALTRGAGLTQRMDDLIHAGTRAMRNKTDVRTELLTRRRSEMPPELRYEASTLAGQLVINPAASTDGVAPPAVSFARAVVLEAGPGIWVIDARFHGPSSTPITHRSDWHTLAKDRARWVDWHQRAAQTPMGAACPIPAPHTHARRAG